MRYVELKPIYGYGWAEGGVSIDTPSPFTIQIRKFEIGSDSRTYSKLFGKIDEGSLQYGGKWAYLQVRSIGDKPNYNIKICNAPPPAIEEGWHEPTATNTIATGFAQIQKIVD